MNFASPSYLWGLFAVLIPLLIHLWQRRRARRIPFGAILLLLDAEEQTRRRRRFWEYLLLMVRMMVIASLVLALAGPYRLISAPHLALGKAPKAMVFILDDSLSMRRKKEGKSLFEQGKKLLEGFLLQSSELDRLGLLLPASGKALVGENPSELRKKLEQAKPTFLPAQLLTSIEQAEKILESELEREKKIFVISDLQKTSFAPFQKLEEFKGEIYFYDLAQKEESKNFALGRVEIERTGASEITVSVMVYNFSPESEELPLKLWLGEEILARGTIQLRPYQAKEKKFTISLSEGIVAEGKIELEKNDSLPEDNLAYFHLRAGGRVKALIVDGDWSRPALERESYFLERALNPRLNALSRIDPKVISESMLEQENLTSFQVLILANCALLNQKEAEQTRQFVQKGGGLLITLGDKVEPERYNQMLAELLPRQLRGVKIPFAGAEAKSEVQPLHIASGFIGSPDRHPVLMPFSSLSQGDPSRANFYKFFLFAHSFAPRNDVVLELNDRTPLLVEKSFGKGRVMVFASTIDRDWNDLCIYPVYLPLFHQIVLYLAGALLEASPTQSLVGEQIELLLPSEKNSALIQTSTSREFRLRPEKTGEKNLIRIPSLPAPGIYYFFYLPRTEPLKKINADLILSVGLNPEESDLRKISFRELKKLIPAQAIYLESEKTQTQQAQAKTQQEKIKKPIHSYFLLGLILLLGLEILILFRSGQE